MKKSTPFIVASVVGVLAIGLAAKGLAGGGSKPSGTPLSSAKAEDILVKAKIGLKASKDKQDYFRLKFSANDCLENLKVPGEFRELKAQMVGLYAKRDYLECADVATKMEAMLPKNIPADYPFSEDYLSEWRSNIGDLRVLGNDYQGALDDYTKALDAKVPPRKDGRISVMKQLGGHQSAAYGRSFVYALMGKKEKAFADLEAAPGFYWSGCGNCAEGEGHAVDRAHKVYGAASLPAAEAEAKLLKLAAGGYQPLKSQLNCDAEASEKRYAASDAVLFLGELYLKQGKTHLAKVAFDALTVEGFTRNGQMAASRLRKMNLPPR